MQRERLLNNLLKDFWSARFSEVFLLPIAVQPEVVKDKVYLNLMVLFFQSLLHSVDTQSNKDKTPFHIFLQK